MSLAAATIAALDRAIDRAGTPVTFRQINPHPAAPTDTACRAHVRDGDAVVAGNGVSQVKAVVILSPTGLPGLPKKLDQIVIDGKVRTVDLPRFKRIDGQVVRIELDCIGAVG
ncbi:MULTISPECIES: hypothetical protein [unclassified Chelatococcus]|uniref:hypothetical protein n=1 Tax=unclassified Chelatococcus TaxID=2638111 RepID=UPI001BCAA20A|nr:MULTISPECIES: hypothetical protein [unclassified Chelatococcus]CAH1670744.1 conserved hypothetical protein [Hyphomicrobiales bacterium]MBS7738375.1 hypothetical protein [Chelatococcus sp. HY11]MBX3547356.1 hypothetical protein [Chelatococcus sp.]MCO5077279.1 hypothetical protein [Chelatococcus sp.]CAH1677030.1 conserved hypothetical protein [Hyphomicrobiales bacterium]